MIDPVGADNGPALTPPNEYHAIVAELSGNGKQKVKSRGGRLRLKSRESTHRESTCRESTYR
jgi:hypothetical protein